MIWKIPNQTAKKHEILESYLAAWFPILRTTSNELLYIDGFAGPNEYIGGIAGSPQIAVDAAAANSRLYANHRITLLFNEQDKRRFKKLEQWASNEGTKVPGYLNIKVTNKTFSDLARSVIASKKFREDPAVFAFIDPFGFSGVPMDLLAQLASNRRSELLILFAFDSINRFSTSSQVDNSLLTLFGCAEFKYAPVGDSQQRKAYLLDLYERQLREVCHFNYISRFEMIRSDGKTSYFLFHCTRNLRGLEKFRDTVWKADPVSGQRFSARGTLDGALFGSEQWINLDREILEYFSGQEVSTETLEEFVLKQTPYKLSHLRKYGLIPLQDKGLLSAINQKRRHTFPKGTRMIINP